ncbi:hypothetical protein TSOC_013602, partial [Tetrabaena socialis]
MLRFISTGGESPHGELPCAALAVGAGLHLPGKHNARAVLIEVGSAGVATATLLSRNDACWLSRVGAADVLRLTRGVGLDLAPGDELMLGPAAAPDSAPPEDAVAFLLCVHGAPQQHGSSQRQAVMALSAQPCSGLDPGAAVREPPATLTITAEADADGRVAAPAASAATLAPAPAQQGAAPAGRPDMEMEAGAPAVDASEPAASAATSAPPPTAPTPPAAGPPHAGKALPANTNANASAIIAAAPADAAHLEAAAMGAAWAAAAAPVIDDAVPQAAAGPADGASPNATSCRSGDLGEPEPVPAPAHDARTPAGPAARPVAGATPATQAAAAACLGIAAQLRTPGAPDVSAECVAIIQQVQAIPFPPAGPDADGRSGAGGSSASASSVFSRLAGPQMSRLWRSELAELLTRCAMPRTTIGVVGNTGAGKSSILNVLLGEENILPTNGMRASTGCPIEVSYAPSSIYTASVEFVSKDEWHAYVVRLLDDLMGDDGQLRISTGDRPDTHSEAGAAQAALEAVYGKAVVRRPGLSVEVLQDVNNSVTRLLGSTKHIRNHDKKVLRDQTRQLRSRLEAVAAKVHEASKAMSRDVVEPQVREALRPAYQAAAMERGSGSFMRMKAAVEGRVAGVGSTALRQAAGSLEAEVRSQLDAVTASLKEAMQALLQAVAARFAVLWDEPACAYRERYAAAASLQQLAEQAGAACRKAGVEVGEVFSLQPQQQQSPPPEQRQQTAEDADADMGVSGDEGGEYDESGGYPYGAYDEPAPPDEAIEGEEEQQEAAEEAAGGQPAHLFGTKAEVGVEGGADPGVAQFVAQRATILRNLEYVGKLPAGPAQQGQVLLLQRAFVDLQQRYVQEQQRYVQEQQRHAQE